MALTAARKRSIKKAAESAGEDLPEGSQRAQARKDAEEILIHLNTKIEARLDRLETDLIPILHAYAPNRAALVHGVTQQVISRVREIIQVITKGLDGLDGSVIQAAVVEAIADVLPDVHASLLEMDNRRNTRAGKKVDG